MAKTPCYIFDPVQFKEYGHRFLKGDGFYYRCQQSEKLFFKNIYIPFGPVCKNEKGFDNFLEHIKKTRFAKITIDLPTIYSSKITKQITEKLEKTGFRKIPYFFQDEETLLVFPEDLKLDNKKRNIINHGYKFVDIKVKDKINQGEIDEIYKIYLDSAKRIGYLPKDKGLFSKLSENCLVSLAFGKTGEGLEGYVFGYFMDYGKTDFSEKKNNKILLNMFTGTDDLGREHKIGHAMHYELFKSAFENYGADFIDLRGASRTKNRAYIHFKRDFSHNFYQLPGSFKKIFF